MLVEWGNVTINPKYITYIFRNNEKHQITVYMLGSQGYIFSDYTNQERMESDYDFLMRLIKEEELEAEDDNEEIVCQ